jgi:cell division septum initiation protein DivIVA
MDTLHFLTLAGAAIGGAMVGAAACYWPLSRVISELRDRLERSEQARNGAVERSAQAREQIAQLNRSITELRRTHSAHSDLVKARAHAHPRTLIENALAEGDEKVVPIAHREGAQGFADTQVMSKL